MTSLRNLIIGVAALGMISCKPKVPAQYIQPNEMEDILVDYHIGQALAQLEDGSSEQRNYHRILYLDAVLAKHGVTRAEFDSSLVYYYCRADRFQNTYRNVADRLSEQALALGASESEISQYAEYGVNGDTANVWADRTQMILLPYSPYNRFEYKIEADTTYHAGDSFLLNLTSDFLYQSGQRDAVCTVSVCYDNDTVISRSLQIHSAGLTQLRIDPQQGLTPKLVRGYIYLKSTEASAVLRLMFVSNIQLVRFHNADAVAPKAPDVAVDSVNTDSVRQDSMPKVHRLGRIDEPKPILPPSATDEKAPVAPRHFEKSVDKGVLQQPRRMIENRPNRQ